MKNVLVKLAGRQAGFIFYFFDITKDFSLFKVGISKYEISIYGLRTHFI